jgi:hypothetical protein
MRMVVPGGLLGVGVGGETGCWGVERGKKGGGEGRKGDEPVGMAFR